MHLLLIGTFAVAAPAAFGTGLFRLQAYLERWDQRRHAED
jgi:hypothetical protein